MKHISETFDSKKLLEDARKKGQERALKEQQEKEKLKQEVMHDFNDADSAPFWDKCFKYVPFKTIKILLSNMKSLESDEYIIKNKPGFFINLLKKQGLFPFTTTDLILIITIAPLYYFFT